jgi:hypothetical protein
MVLLGKKLKHLAYLLVPMATIPALGVDTPFDPAPWVQYLHQMQAALSEKYANFEWTVFERQADLSALFARAESRILDSGSDADARGAIDRLPRNLGDGHVVVDWPAHRRSLTDTARAGVPRQRSLCQILGCEAYKSGAQSRSSPKRSRLGTAKPTFEKAAMCCIGSACHDHFWIKCAPRWDL